MIFMWHMCNQKDILQEEKCRYKCYLKNVLRNTAEGF